MWKPYDPSFVINIYNNAIISLSFDNILNVLKI